VPAGNAARRCATIIRDTDIPEPFDLGRFLARLVMRRGRMILLHFFTSGPGIPCGLWIETARADHIFCEEATSAWHQTHIVTHEIASTPGYPLGGKDGCRVLYR
jgi:hypothetical protein